jgi:hypothetical protein
MDNQLFSSKKIYEYEEEMIYISKYVCGLYDYMMYNKLTPMQKKMITDEIVRVNFYVDRKKRKIEEWLRKYNYSKENRLKIKKFHNEAKQSIN